MSIVEYEFTKSILEIINLYFPDQGTIILNSSELFQ